MVWGLFINIKWTLSLAFKYFYCTMQVYSFFFFMKNYRVVFNLKLVVSYTWTQGENPVNKSLNMDILRILLNSLGTTIHYQKIAKNTHWKTLSGNCLLIPLLIVAYWKQIKIDFILYHRQTSGHKTSSAIFMKPMIDRHSSL